MKCSDGVCGVCGPCRREHRLHTRTAPPPPVTLSPRAKSILDEGAYFEPVTGKRTKAPRRPTKTKTLAQGRESRAENPTPVDCTECGELRILVKSGKGQALVGGDGLCEVCFGNRKWRAWFAEVEQGRRKLSPQMQRVGRRVLERVNRDGRAFHPDANHGTQCGYGQFGCRCDPCRQVRSRVNRTNLERQDAA